MLGFVLLVAALAGAAYWAHRVERTERQRRADAQAILRALQRKDDEQ